MPATKAREDDNEIMTVAEVAQYLQLAEKTVLRMVQRGEIPAAKVASQWRFLRPLVRQWLVARMQSFGQPAAEPAASASLLPLTEVIRPELMGLHLEPGSKEAVLRQLVAPLLKTGFARDVNQLLDGLLERERMMSTGIGHGVAMPHPRRPIPGMFREPAIALGICPDGTDFDAIDDQYVHVFFLICSTREEVHLQLMARVAWLSRQDVVDDLGRVKSAEEATALIARTVRKFAASAGQG